MELNDKEYIQRLEDRIYCLESIIQNVSEGVFFTDHECKISVFNPAKEKMEQINAEEVLGRMSWEPYSHSNIEVSEHKRVFDTHIPIINAYRPHAYVDDIPVYIYYSTRPVIKDGRVLGVYTVSRNETILRELLYDTIEHKRQLRPDRYLETDEPPLAKGTSFSFANMVGDSPAMKGLIKDAQTIAHIDTSILITGETGTGKEVLAQSIHNFGRENKKFVAINCAAIPESLVESILFGSVKGAYTGAADIIGLFQEAGDGTLFLDEINSMSITMQAKLLRALQENCVRPVGSLQEYPIKCRLISASNEEPDVLIREKRLRPDLFYRISGFCLQIPPLRERKEDIVELAWMFIYRYNQEFHKNIVKMSDDLVCRLRSCPWDGNTRELQHIIQNMLLRVPELSTELDSAYYPQYALSASKPPAQSKDGGEFREYLNTGDINTTVKQLQKDIITHRLIKNKWNISKTAKDLGVYRQNLLTRMNRLSIDKPGSRE